MPYICTMQACEVEKAELRKEIERLRKALDEREGDMHARIRAGYDTTIADSWRKEVARVEAERDALRAALQSIANNTCCGQCQEAALVAKAALDAARKK